MLVYAFDQGGATTAGVVALVQLIPAALFAPYGGVLSDRYSPAAVLLAGYLLPGIAMGGAAACLLTDAPSALVYAFAALAAALVTMTRPAQAVLVPELVHEPDQLTAFNVVAGWIESAGILIGPALTGVVLAFSGPGTVFAISAVLSLAAVPALAGLVPRTRRPSEPDGSVVEGTLKELATGLRAVGGAPAARLLVVMIAAQMVVLGAFDVLAVVLAIDTLDIGQSGAGYLNAAFGAGGVIGAAATVALIGRKRLAPPLLIGAFVTGVPFVLLGAWPTVVGAFLLMAVAGGGRIVFDVSGRTLLQRAAQPELLSRTFALLEALSMASLALGSILVPLLVALGGAEAAVIGAGVVLPALALLRLRALRAIDSEATVPIVELSLLRSMNIFAPLPAPALEGLARSLVPKRVAAGTVVMREGDPGEHFFAVAEGEVEISIGGRHVATRGRSEGLGEIALLKECPRTATVTAATDTLLYGLDKGPFLAAVTGHAPTAEAAEGLIQDLLAPEPAG